MNKAKTVFLMCALLLVCVLTGCSAKEDASPAMTANPTVPSVTAPADIRTLPPAATASPVMPTVSPTAEQTNPPA